jgi:putative copper export protein
VTITGWSLVRFLHVLAAMGWVGGQLALSLVVVPVMRAGLSPEVRAPVMRAAGHRFAVVANVALLPLLVVTGIALALHRNVTWGTFTEPGYGRLLGIKLVFVVASVGFAAAHGIVASRSPQSIRSLAIAGLASSVAVVVFATALVP